jgi:hypothetical protein
LQLLDKCKLGFTKDKVEASQIKQMVLAFFDSKGMVYTGNVQRGTKVNADYIVGVLSELLKALHQKYHDLVPVEEYLHSVTMHCFTP